MVDHAALAAPNGRFFLFFEDNVYFCVYLGLEKTLANTVIARVAWHADGGTRTLCAILRMHKQCS